MGHTNLIVPETVSPSQRSTDAKDQQKIANCVRNIQLLNCTLIVNLALCIAIIGVLSWHIVRSVPSEDQVTNRNESNAETEKTNIENITIREIVDILEGQREMISLLQLNLDQVKQEINRTCEEHARKLDAQESAVKLVSETHSANITQLQVEVKNLDYTVTNLETKLQEHNRQFDTQELALKTLVERLQFVNETVMKLHTDDVRQLSNDVQKRLEDILTLKVVSENSSTEILRLRAEVKTQEETIRDLESKIQALDTSFDVQVSVVKTMQNINETITQLHLDDVMKLKNEGRMRSHDILMLKTLYENSSDDIRILKTEIKNQNHTIINYEANVQDLNTQLVTQKLTLKTYGAMLRNVSETMTQLLEDNTRKFQEETEKYSDDILMLKIVSENTSTAILGLQDQEEKVRDLDINFQALDAELRSQKSTVKTNGDMLKSINETLTTLRMNDVKELKDDAGTCFENILLLMMVSENSSTKISSLQAIVKNQETKIKDLETQLKEPPGSGSTFTRWGRPDCPGNGTELVYSGYVGGGHYDNGGSAVNHLCMTKKPTWNHTITISNQVYLYGAEYAFHSTYISTYFGQNLQDHEPPCAVCRSTRDSVIMIPGTNICTEGWTREYTGYLVAGAASHDAASEYICLESGATIAEGSNKSDNDGKLMYLVTTKCGSLKCPPYVDQREVTCVVCTR